MDAWKSLSSLIQGFIHGMPAWAILVVPIALILVGVGFALATIPEAIANHYFFIALLFAVVTLSRMIQLWEFGIQVYTFLIFTFSFVYGPISGLIFVVLSSAIMIYQALFLPNHMTNHSLFGPAVQSLELCVMAVIAGTLGYLGYFPFILPAVAICMALTFFEKFMANRFVGIDWGRLSAAQVVEVAINYNLFAIYTDKMLLLLRTI